MIYEGSFGDIVPTSLLDQLPKNVKIIQQNKIFLSKW